MAVSPRIAWCAHYAAIALLLKIISIVFPDFLFCYFTCTAHFILYAFLASLTHGLCKKWYNDERIKPDGKAILITGCDSGFGNALAKRLDSNGFHVFASCLFPDGEGAKELKRSSSNRLQIFYLDVAKDESVDKSLNFVKQNIGSNVLWAVVNNAGISKGCSTELSSIDEFKETIDINALGPVRVTKAFLPLLKKSKGRVVNVTSLAARVPTPENATAYTMSKCAALAFTQCLSMEMKVWGIRVISIEPEIFRTGITIPELFFKRVEAEVSKVSEDILAMYGAEYLEKRNKAMEKALSLASTNISTVVDNMEAAITDKYPEYAYKPRRNIFARVCCYVIEHMSFDFYEYIVQFILKIVRYPIPKAVKDGVFH